MKDFQKTCKELGEKFSLFYQNYEISQSFLEIEPRLKRFIESQRKWIQHLRQPEFPIAFLGTFSAGKSTAINAILGNCILPEKTKSLTAKPTIIKAGDQDRAVVHYFSQDDKIHIADFYLKEINRIRKKDQPDERDAAFRWEEKEERKKCINMLHSELKPGHKDGFRKEIQGSYQEVCHKLRVILEDWDRIPKEHAREISISDIEKYVTEESRGPGGEEPRSALVDRVEVCLSRTRLPRDIIFVDLPGLGVTNKIHRRITMDFIEEKAKAFVVCMKPTHLLEGQEIEFIERVNINDSKVLRRAFWLIGHWDTLTDGQKNEVSETFSEKISQYKFNISPDRVYRVSALNNLLYQIIAEDGSLDNSPGLQKHFDAGKLEGLTKKKALEKLKKDSFSKFREDLYHYLEKGAKNEFLIDAESAYRQIRDALFAVVKRHHDGYQSGAEDKQSIISRYSRKNGEKVLRRMKREIRESARAMRLEITSDYFTVWSDKTEEVLLSRIGEAVSGIDRLHLRDLIARGKHADRIIPRLPDEVEKILNTQRMMEDFLSENTKSAVYDQFSLQLLNNLRKTGNKALPQQIEEKFEDMLGERDFRTRISGLADCLFYDYGHTIEKTGADLIQYFAGRNGSGGKNGDRPSSRLRNKAEKGDETADSGVPDKEVFDEPTEYFLKGNSGVESVIEKGLNMYREKLTEMIRGNKENINKYTARCLKNYIEDMECRLMGLVSDEYTKDLIVEKIGGEMLVDEELEKELRKREFVDTLYTSLCS